MRIRLNGETRELPPGTTVEALLEELGLDPARVAVELNRRILKRADFAGTELGEGDEVEVVTFVGGG